jgi:hypothetical protein
LLCFRRLHGNDCTRSPPKSPRALKRIKSRSTTVKKRCGVVVKTPLLPHTRRPRGCPQRSGAHVGEHLSHSATCLRVTSVPRCGLARSSVPYSREPDRSPPTQGEEGQPCSWRAPIGCSLFVFARTQWSVARSYTSSMVACSFALKMQSPTEASVRY